MKKRLKNIYKLDDSKVKRILKLNYKGWSRLSKELLLDIRCDNSFASSASILYVMEESNKTLMEIISDDKLGYKKKIEEYNFKERTGSFAYADIEKLAGSPAIKKGIWQSLKIVDEIIKYMGYKPKNIYIEFARQEGEKKRTLTQVKKIKECYADISEQCRKDYEVKKEILNYDDKTKLDNDVLYLYFTQMGKCMYSGNELNIDDLHLYQVDHIVPRSLNPDDNSIDNRVLVLPNKNQRKLDDLVVPADIRNKMRDWWEYLHEHKLISDVKYYRLMRTEFNKDTLERFIDKQLVETRQIIKHVANILTNYYSGTKVMTIRANLTHEFRVKYNIHKFRDLNSYHHAHDAYITSVIGEYINNRYPQLNAAFEYGQYIKNAKKNKNNHEKSGFIINSMNYDAVDYDTGEVIWKKDKIVDILKCFDYKDCFITRKLEDIDGMMFTETVYPNDNNRQYSTDKTKPSIPLNKEREDVKKYGGYSNVKCLMYAIEGRKNNKKGTIVRKISKVPIIYKNNDVEFKNNYIKQQEDLKEVKIIKEIKKYQLIEIDGALYYITASSELINARQLLLSQYFRNILASVNNALKSSKYEECNDKLINELYKELVDKTIMYYPKFKNKMLIFKEKENDFKKLDMKDKCKVISQMIIITTPTASNGNIKLNNFNIGDRLIRLAGQNINLDHTVFIYQSITGIYSQRKKL